MSYEQVRQRFGDPKLVAATYVNEMETDELLEKLHVSGMIFKTVLVTSVVIAVVWAGFLTIAYGDHEKDMNGYMIIETVEVEKRNTLGEGEN